MAAAGWHADPSGRHEERFYDGETWTDLVRDRGVGGNDPVDTAIANPAPAATPAPAMTVQAPWAPTVVAPAPHVTAGLPWFMMLALAFAAFPAVLALGMGSLAVMAGNDISDAGNSYEYGYGNDDYGYSDSDSLVDVGNTTTDAGTWMAIIGGTALVFVVMAGTGSSVGRVITLIWLGCATVYLLSRIDEMPDGTAGYLLLFIAPPVLAIIGLLSPAANKIYAST